MRPIIFLFSVIFLSLTSLSASAQDDDLSDSVKAGIQSLYAGQKCDTTECLSFEQLNRLTQQALAFKKRFDGLIAANSGLPVVEWSNNPRELNRKTFSFPSLLQREVGHPSNLVKGIIYYPRQQNPSQPKKPATLLIHKISNDIRNEELFASMATNQNRGTVMIIYLPNYGPRQKTLDESFITENPEQFLINITQALVDIHQAYKILASLDVVDSHNIGLAGFSLGGIITLISAGVDPIFDRYLTIVGGGDLAYTMSYKYRHVEDTTSETAQALKNVTWKPDEARKILSQIDPITWALNIKGKKITMINAVDDELLDLKMSINKLFNIYKVNNNKSIQMTYPGGHVVDLLEIGLMKSFKSMINPFFGFLSGE